MLADQFRALFLFYVSPRRAASAILDQGRLLFGIFAAVLVALAISGAASVVESREVAILMQEAAPPSSPDPVAMAEYYEFRQSVSNQLRGRYFATGLKILVVLGVIFVPFCLLVLAAWDHLGGG